VVQEEFVWFGDQGSQRPMWQVVVEAPARGFE
jgi:hypothetical protein